MPGEAPDPLADSGGEGCSCGSGSSGSGSGDESGGDPQAQLDALVWLHILRGVQDDLALCEYRCVSKRLRDLVDVVLEERFLAKWGLAGVAAPPPAAPAYAAARPAAFVLCVALRGRESLAALAVRHGTDVTALKRLNNLLSDNALQSRTLLYVPIADAAAFAAGKRAAFVHDEHSKRRLIVLMGTDEALPAPVARGAGGGPSPRPPREQAYIVDKLAGVLQRALKVDEPTATYYIKQANCDLRAAMERFEEDRRWEKAMRRRRGAQLNFR